MMKTILAFVAIGAMSLGVTSIAGIVEDKIDARLSPPGAVCVEGGECAVAIVAVAGGSADRGAEEVYNAACMACHMTGAAGAPILGDSSAWSSRITQGAEILYGHAINGIGAMSAKGGCMSCSDNEVKSVVDYMIEQAG
ncbi:MAG: cytochrome c5 [Chitinophagales bacterium]|jgi:cytochrome c5